MQEKVWVVIQQNKDGIGSVLAFDHEVDAKHFAGEMDAGGRGPNTVIETTISRRRDAEEAIAFVELPEFDAGCIEHIMDIAQVPEEKQEEAAKCLEEHQKELQKGAQDAADEYLKHAITDYFTHDRIILG